MKKIRRRPDRSDEIMAHPGVPGKGLFCFLKTSKMIAVHKAAVSASLRKQAAREAFMTASSI
jgi:hypothetical protein